MPSRSNKEHAFLDDIRAACSTIVDRISHRKFTDLVSNGEFRDSIVLQLLVIGEAASHLTIQTRRHYPRAPWREMIGLRNLLVHHYWTIDFIKIWEVAQEDVPNLLEMLTS